MPVVTIGMDIAGVNPETLHIITHEVPKTNWGRNGVLSSDLPGEKR